MNPGDRVIVRRAYRARGIGAGPGGWKWQEHTGTVTYATKKNVWVKLDTQPGIEFVDQYPIYRARKVEK